MRRVPAATPLSETIAKSPISPVARTCVPPHSSRLKPGIETTRTVSPYFSPKSAIAPAAIASCVALTSVWTGVFLQDLLVDDLLDLEQLLARQCREVDEVEAQPIGRDERSGLLDVRAEHLSKRRMQQVSGRVIAPRGVADGRGDGRGHQVAPANGAAGDLDRVQSRPVRNPDDAGDRGLAVGAADRARVRHLSAGFEVERRLLERDEPGRSGLEAVDLLAARDRTARSPGC